MSQSESAPLGYAAFRASAGVASSTSAVVNSVAVQLQDNAHARKEYIRSNTLPYICFGCSRKHTARDMSLRPTLTCALEFYRLFICTHCVV